MHRGRDDYDYERLLKRHKEERMRGDRYEGGTERDTRYEQQEYTSICLNGLHPSVPGHILKDEIYRQFSKFGELTIRIISSNPENRIAFCNYYEPESAREAKRARKNLIMFDLPVHIEAVYNRRRSPSPNGYSKGGYHSRASPGSGHHVSPEGYEEYADGYYDDPSKRSKDHHRFPYHLNHVPPEDDANANRTLFVGNVDMDIKEVDIRSIFERYGTIEEIDIKRPQKCQGNAYAFIKYYNVDMAHRAKVDMSGRYIGRYQCKIGYGKPTATNCLWIGGLGPWVRADVLEQEFDRFGVINRIEWPHGKGYAYVLFDSVDAASAANTAMRGVALGGPEHRIRVDYADESHMPSRSSKSPRQSIPCDEDKKSERVYSDTRKHREEYSRDRTRSERDYNTGSEYRNQDHPENDRYRKEDYDRISVASDRRRQSGKSHDGDRSYTNRNHQPQECVRSSRDRDTEKDESKYSPDIKRRRTASPVSVRSPDEKERLSESEHKERKRTTSSDSANLPVNIENATNIEELAKALHVVWNGALVLKNSAFAARMHLVSGDVHLVDTLMRDITSTELPVLKITQRLRLDLPKLEEVGRRVATSGTNGHAVLLAMPGSTESVDETSYSVQQRPLRNLISYLKQKEAAGVISLPPNPGKDKDNIGVLHAFPPCHFGSEFLTKQAEKLTCDLTKDDHLVIIVVRGAV